MTTKSAGALVVSQKPEMGGGSEGLEGETIKLEDQVVKLRKEYDDLRHGALAKEKEVKAMTDKLKDLERESIRPNSEDSPLTRQIRTLENRLDKAMIKYNEAQSIRKTYEQIVKRLKEERIGFDNQLQAIERTLKAKEHDLEELMLMSHDANHAKEVAKAELAKLEQQIADERKQREKELAERRAVVQQKMEMAQRLEKREKMRREIQAEAAGDLGEEGERALKKSVVTNVFHHAMNEQKLEEEAERITTFEEAFRKIKDATGVGDVNEVIQKFLTQEDTHNNLIEMTKDAQKRIDALNEEKNALKAKVEEVKYSGAGNFGSRTVVDQFESHLTTSNAKCERNRQKYERIAKILINVKAGIAHLGDKLDGVKIDEPPVPMSDDTVVPVLQHCEKKLMHLMDVLKIDPEKEKEQYTKSGRHVALAQGGEDLARQENNIRVKLPDRTQEELSDDEGDEDAEEDVPDRDQMKRLASMMLEKATKKTKRKKRAAANAAPAPPGSAPAGATARAGSGGRETPSEDATLSNKGGIARTTTVSKRV
eukprot:tig00021463_g21633.t1